MPLHRLVVLERIQRRRPLHENIQRIRCDDVVLILRRHQIVPRVVVHDPRLRIILHRVILRRKEPGRGRRNHRLNFANRDMFDARVSRERPRRNTRAESNSQYRLRVRMQNRGQMPDHSLQLHIEDLGRGFHVPVDVHVNRAVVPARNRHRRVAAFLRIKDFRHPLISAHKPPVGNQFARRRVDVPGEQSGGGNRSRQSKGAHRLLSRGSQQ